MDYEKLKEYGQSIKLTDEAKAEITANCKAVQSEKRGGIMLTAAAKRTAAVLAAAAVIIAGIACVKYLKQPAPKIDNTEKTSTVINSAENSTAPSPTETQQKTNASTSTEESTKFTKQNNLSLSEDIGGTDITTRKYRVRYYSVPYQFALLVGLDTFWEWDEQFDSEVYAGNDQMVIKEFVQYFNISREDFDRANLEFAKVVISGFGGQPIMNPQDYTNQEIHEIYNADIIYTFDDEIINEYYLSKGYLFDIQTDYENAVANGTYETRTTDWVDIEQMEAEINAKYGVPEVTETTTAKPEETETPE